MKKLLKRFSVLAVTFFLLHGCASTTLKTVWMDEAYKGGPLKKVFVMGVSHKPTVKRFFEDEFARALKARGTDAITSYATIPQEKMNDKDFIASKIKELGADAVLVTMLVDKKTMDTYYPPEVRYSGPSYRGGWYGYYSRGYSYSATPGYVVREQVVVLETNVYDLNTEKPIFSALSETYIEDSPDALIRSFVQLMIKELGQKHLIK